MIACDCQATHGSGFKFKVKTKLFEFDNKRLWPVKFTVGYCGNLDAIPDVLEFLGNEDGTTRCPRYNKNSEYVILTEDHKIFLFYTPDKWILVDDSHYAIGSGMHYALGAMKAGNSPKEAVLAASKLDPLTGLGIKVIEYP